MQASAVVAMGSVVAFPGLWSTGSIVAVHGFSCSMECGIYPDQGLNLCFLHWQVDSTEPSGKPKGISSSNVIMLLLVPFRDLGGHISHADSAIHIELIILSLVK